MTDTTTPTATVFPLDWYQAESMIKAAIADFPMVRDPDTGLTTEQRKKRRGSNFMAPDRIRNIRVGGKFLVEIATGTFLSSRMVGVTVFRLGGARENDSDLNQCVHSVEELKAALAGLTAPIQYKRGCEDYRAIRDAASHPEQVGVEVGEEEFNDMLGCVPPIYVEGVPGFLVGEALSSDERGTVYANYYESRDGLFCARYHVVKD